VSTKLSILEWNLQGRGFVDNKNYKQRNDLLKQLLFFHILSPGRPDIICLIEYNNFVIAHTQIRKYLTICGYECFYSNSSSTDGILIAIDTKFLKTHKLVITSSGQIPKKLEQQRQLNALKIKLTDGHSTWVIVGVHIGSGNRQAIDLNSLIQDLRDEKTNDKSNDKLIYIGDFNCTKETLSNYCGDLYTVLSPKDGNYSFVFEDLNRRALDHIIVSKNLKLNKDKIFYDWSFVSQDNGYEIPKKFNNETGKFEQEKLLKASDHIPSFLRLPDHAILRATVTI
jgi:endonuclease/exonuclease/phosphatase family metal-dependent hydrolase